ncbi:acyltransferase [Neptunicella sp. SCSIO 80796]|uniref:LpxL/LpxP family acyltransferase n=1 Tax=Neptunicella plasticusilytica TaxID=3117012 RepID=UPI003A4D9803
MSQHWSAIAERGNQFGIQFLLQVYKLFGKWLLKLLLIPVICYFYLTDKRSRRASLQFLRRAYQCSQHSPFKSCPGFRQGLKHFFSFGFAALDKIDSWLGQISSQQISYHNYPLFESLISQRKGAVFIGSHLGNLEVCRALGQRQYPIRINVLVHTHHAEAFNKMLKQVSDEVDLNLIQVTTIGPDIAILLKERIEQGEFVVIVGDRTPINNPGRISLVDFMGKQAPFSQGPMILASLLDCPVYLLFCMKQKAGYKIIFEPFAEPALPLPRKDRHRLLDVYCQQYANRLAHYAGLYPYQWYNFFDFWQHDVAPDKQDNKAV